MTQGSRASWHPTAKIETLRAKAKIFKQVRQFFEDRQVLEVQTPLLLPTTVTDPFIDSFACESKQGRLFLQTSPEYAMKRLLAAGSGSIFQLTPAFRQEEVGTRHQSEFAMLEWYRIGFDDATLIAEVDDLLRFILQTKPAYIKSYRQAFEETLQINPHQTSLKKLHTLLRERSLFEARLCETIDDCLYMLMSMVVEPSLEKSDRPVFITEYPANQAALARKKRVDGDLVSGRFELYFKGLELANGYYELTDPLEQRKRFEEDRARRKQLYLPDILPDNNLIAALEAGLPDCAGVALGLDRLIMIALNAPHIQDVQSFAIF